VVVTGELTLVVMGEVTAIVLEVGATIVPGGRMVREELKTLSLGRL
jgi:hypothetical protein